MSFDLIIKIVVAFVSMLSLIIAFFNIRFNSRKTLIDEYTVAKAFLEDLDNLKNKFVIEKGYQAVAGSDTFDIDVIKHLLLFPNPSRALRDYRIAHSLFCKNRVNGRLRFKWRFRSLWVRNGMAIFHFLIYWLFAMSVFYCLLSPFYIPDFAEDFFSGLGFDQTKQWIFIVFTLVISLYLVVLSLYKLAVYYSAKRLFEQEKQWLDFE